MDDPTAAEAGANRHGHHWCRANRTHGTNHRNHDLVLQFVTEVTEVISCWDELWSQSVTTSWDDFRSTDRREEKDMKT